VLGAAKIAPAALIKPARKLDEIDVRAIAARDRAKAESFAAKHGIPNVHDGYQALIDDPSIDAIYNPLPNGLHGRWTIAALEAGKHVLCEKPFTANADEAEAVAAVADRSRRVVMEAFHYRYHPLIDRILEIVRAELGTVRHVETWMIIPLPSRRDIRTEPRASPEPTYMFQLRAFAGAVLRGEPILTGPADSIANMRVIDAAYRAAGLEPRRPSLQ